MKNSSLGLQLLAPAASVGQCPVSFYGCGKTKRDLGRKTIIWLTHADGIPSLKEARIGSEGRSLQTGTEVDHRGVRVTALLPRVAQPVFSDNPRPTPMGWTLTHWSLPRECPHKLVYRPNWRGHFLS